MRPALGRPQHTVTQHPSFLCWAARAAGGGGQAAGGGQGFGPRPGARRRGGGHQRRQAGGGGSARSPVAAAAAGHNTQPTLEEVEDSGWEGAQRVQAQAQAAEPEQPAPQADDGGGGGDGTMHGQPPYKAGLPSSRSDTMLQTEEQQRYGLLGSGMGPPGPGLARNAVGQHSMPAVGAAAAAGAAPPIASKASSNSIPVYVMLPLDTVCGCWRMSHLAGCGCCKLLVVGCRFGCAGAPSCLRAQQAA